MRLVDLPASATALALARIAVYGVWLAVLLRDHLPTSALLPFEWFQPWGPLMLLPESALRLLLHPAGLWSVHLVACGLSVALMLGVRPFKTLACALVLVTIVSECLSKGFSGYANHAQFATLYAMVILAIFPCADALSVLGRPRHIQAAILYRAPMVVAPFVIALTYMVIGLRRITEGNLGIFLDETILTYVIARSHQYSGFGFEIGLLIPSSPFMVASLKFGYFVTTVAEIVAPLVILFGWRLRLLWLAIIVPFHFLSLFTMNIFFWENVVLLLVFFTGLPHWIAQRWSLPELERLPAVAR